MDKEKIKEEINKALEVLRNGGVILYPTDTIWGIGCDATNQDAVNKIYEIKQREDSKTMLVLLDDIGRIASYAEVPEVAYELLEVSDQPMTIIYPNAKNIAKNLIASDGTVGIRVTNEFFTKGLVSRFKKPIVSTSANITGENTPSIFIEIDERIKQQVDYIVDYRQNDKTISPPSSIIKLGTGGEIQIIRK